MIAPRSIPAAIGFAALAGVGLMQPTGAQPINLFPSPAASSPGAGAVVSQPLAPPPLASEALPYLQSARVSLQEGRDAAAGEALERAETRLLGIPPARPAGERAVRDIRAARDALARRDRVTAKRAVDDAVVAVRQTSASPAIPAHTMAPAVVAPRSPAPATYALLPGHWQRQGWQYVWVPPETQLRRVEDRLLVPGQYVWRDGSWQWVPSHCAGN